MVLLGALSQVPTEKLHAMEDAVSQSIGYISLVTRYLESLLEEGHSNHAGMALTGIINLEVATTRRLEAALADLYRAARKQARAKH